MTDRSLGAVVEEKVFLAEEQTKSAVTELATVSTPDSFFQMLSHPSDNLLQRASYGTYSLPLVGAAVGGLVLGPLGAIAGVSALRSRITLATYWFFLQVRRAPQQSAFVSWAAWALALTLDVSCRQSRSRRLRSFSNATVCKGRSRQGSSDKTRMEVSPMMKTNTEAQCSCTKVGRWCILHPLPLYIVFPPLPLPFSLFSLSSEFRTVLQKFLENLAKFGKVRFGSRLSGFILCLLWLTS